MNSLLTELGKKLVDQWMSLLVLPGALYLAVAVAGRSVGHAHALSLGRLTDQITDWAGSASVSTISGQVILLAAVLAGSASVGLTAQILGSMIEKSSLAADWWTWPAPLRATAHRLTAYRQRRWRTAAAAWHRHREKAARSLTMGQRLDPTERRAAKAAMLRIAAEYPDRPTWCGDRVHAVAVRMDRDHHVDLAVVMPHLWLVLPEEVRAEITAARQALTRATTLTAWAILYGALTIWWWPAALIATGIVMTGWWRIRASVNVYATLLEATTRIHSRNLAEHLGLDPPPSLTPETGDTLTRLLTPGVPSPSTFNEVRD
ncbi:hypothetical protein ACIRPH_10020 [Nocardiopsis sp. NPDC101807]|uniref:hypothetical protein n=1 Tax=Nocardiopsis sp. NPDC101807 TaxID=3364339 RepID=UPI003805BE37